MLLLGTAIVLASVVVALLVHRLVDRLVPLDVLEAHHTVAGHMLAVIGGTFGILLAFAVVVVWEQYDRAREGAASEANAAADLGALVRALPPPAGEGMSREIGEYLHAVITTEWPQMSAGRADPAARAELGDVWTGLTAFEPLDDRERDLHLAALDRLAALSDSRRVRLLHAEHRMPGLLWAVLLVGAILTLAHAYFFGLRYRRSQAAMVAALAGLLALVLFTVWALDHPYRGSTGIRSADFRLALEGLQGPPR